MLTESFLLPIPYIRHIAEQLREMGADVERWLAMSQLSEAKLSSPAFKLDSFRFEALVCNAIAMTGEPALGLLVGQRLTIASHGLLGLAVVSCSTVLEGAEILARFMPVRTSLVSFVVEGTPQGARVCFEGSGPAGDTRRAVLEAVVLSVKNVLDTISVGRCQVSGVAFAFDEPGYAALARELFGCEIEYGASWSGFSLPLKALEVPLKTADPEALREAALVCQRELDALTADESVSARARRVILAKRDGMPSLEVTARMLHMTTRTLHRRLVDEGTSFREIIEEVRHTLAVEHLKSGRSSLQEIAYMLGYSDLANFRRAFKRWEAVPPSSFRRRAG